MRALIAILSGRMTGQNAHAEVRRRGTDANFVVVGVAFITKPAATAVVAHDAAKILKNSAVALR